MADLKIGVIGLPGKWSTEVLADAVEKSCGFRLVIDMSLVTLDLAEQRLLYKTYDLCQFDALIVKKISARYSPNTIDRVELLRTAEQAGVKVFSPAANILRLINRLSCTVSLAGAGIPMPATRITENFAEAMTAVEDFGEAVFKPLYSTKARGMAVIGSKSGFARVKRDIENFQSCNPMMYIQKKLSLGGKDLGLMFLAGDYLGAYARLSKSGEWNTTINSGGAYAATQPSQAIIDIADNAQSLFGMDFTTVDIAETEDGPIVFEVSAFGGFRGAQEGMGINVAELYVTHVLKTLIS